MKADLQGRLTELHLVVTDNYITCPIKSESQIRCPAVN